MTNHIDLTIPVHDDTEVAGYAELNGCAYLDIAEQYGVITIGAYGAGPRVHIELTEHALTQLAAAVATAQVGLYQARVQQAQSIELVSAQGLVEADRVLWGAGREPMTFLHADLREAHFRLPNGVTRVVTIGVDTRFEVVR